MVFQLQWKTKVHDDRPSKNTSRNAWWRLKKIKTKRCSKVHHQHGNNAGHHQTAIEFQSCNIKMIESPKVYWKHRSKKLPVFNVFIILFHFYLCIFLFGFPMKSLVISKSVVNPWNQFRREKCTSKCKGRNIRRRTLASSNDRCCRMVASFLS